MKKSKQSAQRKNTTLNQLVLNVDDAVFGKAIKKLGHSQFQIQTTDAENRAIEVTAAIAGKSVVRIDIGDILIVGRNESSKHVTYEILGALDKKTIHQLRQDKRLHNAFFSDVDELGDDLFDRSEEVNEEEVTAAPKMEKGNKPVKKDKIVLDNDDDVDVDAI